MAVKHLRITGQVQGVGFRYSMVEAAESRGVTGWVRNQRDGSVEAVVAGSDEQVSDIIEWARKGPSMSRVDRVDVFDATGSFSNFSIKPTGAGD